MKPEYRRVPNYPPDTYGPRGTCAWWALGAHHVFFPNAALGVQLDTEDDRRTLVYRRIFVGFGDLE